MEETSVSSLQNELAQRQRKIEEQERVIHKLKNELNEFPLGTILANTG